MQLAAATESRSRLQTAFSVLAHADKKGSQLGTPRSSREPLSASHCKPRQEDSRALKSTTAKRSSCYAMLKMLANFATLPAKSTLIRDVPDAGIVPGRLRSAQIHTFSSSNIMSN